MAKNKLVKSKAVVAQKKVDTVFVMMPFEEWPNIYYRDIYSKAIKKVGLTPKKLDDFSGPAPLVQEMSEETKNAKMVLVDLTGNNANVCYELGLSHGFNKPTILVTDSIEKIPFDVSIFRVIVYDKNLPNWGKKLKDDLISSLMEVNNNPQKYAPSRALRNSEASESAQGEAIDLGLHELLLQKEIEEMKLSRRINERRHLSTEIHPLTIGPNEASSLLSTYIKEKRPNSFIISRLVRLGAPRNWVIRELERKRK
jgi:hypothetical protein